METCRSKQKYLLLGGVWFSGCPMFTGFTVHNKSNCKISISNKLALHIAQTPACKDIENRLQAKSKIINSTYKIILQNTKTARILVYNTQLQYLEIEGNVFHDQYPKVNLMFLFISFFNLSVISVSSSHSYLPIKWPKSSLSWLEKNSRVPSWRLLLHKGRENTVTGRMAGWHLILLCNNAIM